MNVSCLVLNRQLFLGSRTRILSIKSLGLESRLDIVTGMLSLDVLFCVTHVGVVCVARGDYGIRYC